MYLPVVSVYGRRMICDRRIAHVSVLYIGNHYGRQRTMIAGYDKLCQKDLQRSLDHGCWVIHGSVSSALTRSVCTASTSEKADALVSAALMCIRSCVEICRTPESTGVLDMLVGMCRLGKCWLCCMSVQVRRQISQLLYGLIGPHLDAEVIDCSTCTDVHNAGPGRSPDSPVKLPTQSSTWQHGRCATWRG